MAMKSLKEIVQAVGDLQSPNSTPQLSLASHLPPQVKKTNNGLELSLYVGEKPTANDFKVAANRLSIAFPKMTKEFFLLLTEFVSNEGFTASRLKDAVTHVLANFQYKELNISDIVKFDRRAKLYTYDEVCTLVTQYKARFSDFEIRKINGETFRVKKTDLL
jgi:hypothetical protein